MDPDFSAIVAAFGTNQSKESEGVWCEYSDTISVKLRRSTSPIFRKELRKAFKRFRHMGSALTPEQEDIIKAEAVAKGLVTDWKITNGPDFTAETAQAAFNKAPDFRRWCEEQGDDVDNFKDDRETDLGNSSASSLGSDSGANT